MSVMSFSTVITGLVLVIPIRKAWRSSHRDGRDKPGHDACEMCCTFKNGGAR
jgi:hypothetical protein